MSKKNFEVEDKNTGEKHWISRSVAVLAMVFVEAEDNGPKEITRPDISPNYVRPNYDYKKEVYVLANKRGKNCPNFVGYWNMPCGYLDYDETLQQACTREVMEENGVYISPQKWKLRSINDDPNESPRQNVTVRYSVTLTKEEFKKAKTIGATLQDKYKGEYKEVEERGLVSLDKIDSKPWAFNHKKLIEKYAPKSVNNKN